MVKRLVSVVLSLCLFIANVAPVFAQPDLKLPWDSNFTFRLSAGPHANGFGVCHVVAISKMVALDFAMGGGAEVLASSSGTVVKTGYQSIGGNYVWIDHGGGWQTRYFHLSAILVNQGDHVAQGSLIGRSGSSGSGAAAPHLHFEVRPYVNGIVIDGYRVHAVTVPGNPSLAYNYLGTLTKGNEWVVRQVCQCGGEGMKTRGSVAVEDAESWRNKPISTNRKTTCSFAVGQGSSRAHLFQEAYDRNGGWEKMGCPLSGVWRWYGMERQDFDHPGDWTRPSILLDESGRGPAHVVHGDIGEWFRWHPTEVGPPVSDEYTNAFGARQSDFRNGFVYWNGGIHPPLNYLVRGSGPAIFFMERGTRRWVPDPTTLLEMYPTPTVSVISDDELNNVFTATGPSIPSVGEQWLAQYFDNPNFRRPARAFGSVADDNLNFEWGYGSPHPLIPQDHFSASFSRRFFFEEGVYEFSSTADDNVWVYLDGQLIGSHGLGANNFRYQISEGYHLLRVEYREYTHPAYLRFAFERVDTVPPETCASFNSTASGENGWERGPVTATLRATDDSSGISRIEYNIGSGWETYTAPVSIDGDGLVTFKYRAIDVAGNTESTHSVVFHIDGTAPSSHLGSVESHFNSLPVSIPVSADDSGSGLSRVGIYKRRAGELEWRHHWTSPSGSVPNQFNIRSLAEGEWEFASRAVDVAGNVEELPAEADAVLVFDKTPPVTELSYDGPTYDSEDGKLFVSPETEFVLEADDGLSDIAETDYNYFDTVQHHSESGIYVEPFSLEGEDGSYVVGYSSTDVAGNVEPEKSEEVYLDSTPPVSSDGYDGEWHNEDVPVIVISDDGEGSGVQAIHYWVNDGREEVAKDDQVIVMLGEEGVSELAYYAVDNVENVEEEKHLTLIKIDKTPPAIEWFRDREPNEYGWYNEDVVVRFAATDETSGVAFVTEDRVVKTEGIGQSVMGEAIDNAGNSSTAVVGQINVDKTKPNSEITFPEEGAYYNAESWEGEVRGIASDNLSGVASVGVEVVGQGVGDAQLEGFGELEAGWGYPLGFAEDGSDDGEYTIRSRAVDLAENRETTDEVSFTYDTTPPITSADLSGSMGLNGWYVSPVTLAFGAADETSGVKLISVAITKSGELYHRTTSYDSAEPLVLKDGIYEVEFWSTDLAGNEEEHRTVSFKIDTVAPGIPVSATPGGTFTEGETVAVSLSADEGADIFYSLNDGEFVLYGGPIGITDDAVLAVYAVDTAGNKSPIAEFIFISEPAPPASSDTGSRVLGARISSDMWDGGGAVRAGGTHLISYGDRVEPVGAVGTSDPGDGFAGWDVWPILLVIFVGGVLSPLLRWRFLLRK